MTNNSIKTIFKTYLLVLTCFSIFRFILFLTEIERINFEDTSLTTIFLSFFMGIRFDIVISGYILFIPTFILLVFDVLGIQSPLFRKIIFYWVYVFFVLAFIINAVDIPYFNQFYDRFSISAFKWMDHIDFVTAMIVQEPKYYLAGIPLIIICLLFYPFLKNIFFKIHKPFIQNKYIHIGFSILFLGLMFLGIRGRVQEKSPIKIGTAYFSDNAFLNKLGLNPVFTLMKTYLDSMDNRNKTVQLMDGNIAIENVRNYLGLTTKSFNSPIAREVIPDTVSDQKPNVVLIIMESMSAAKIGRHNPKSKMTPFLDSLIHKSIYFDNFYTSGKHTFNGIFGSLFSFPALYRQQSMRKIQSYDGIASTLLKKGYSTTYFTTHDGQFDNVAGFLKANKFQNIISQIDYPNSEIKTTMGVPDDYMFRYSIPIIDELYQKKQPFFVSFMTASDHGPYYIPDYFTPKSSDIKHQAVEYADWSLKKFIALASKEPWFDNTIFVFVADHGAPLNASYDIALNYFHSPLMFYAPKILSPKTYKKMGSQIDVFPTIMGILKIPYINNTLGIDLFNKHRKYVIINDDDKIGILDSIHFCIMKNNGQKIELYKYRNRDRTNYFEQNKQKAIDMSEYAKSNMQVHQDMILSLETSLENQKPVFQKDDGN